MEKLLDGLRLVLASASPRRRELLLQIGAQVRIASTKEVDESYPGNIAPEDVAPYISAKKAHAYADSIESGETLITADTVVICEGYVLGKPHNEHEAVEMLRQLSGRTHSVVTGVTIMNGERCRTFGVTTEVDFAPLSDSEIPSARQSRSLWHPGVDRLYRHYGHPWRLLQRDGAPATASIHRTEGTAFLSIAARRLRHKQCAKFPHGVDGDKDCHQRKRIARRSD